MIAIENKYNIMSFEKLKLIALKHSHNILQWANEFTKDSMLIVDEVHNLLASTYDEKKFNEIINTGKIYNRAKGMNTILFKIITKYAHPSAKMVLLTATPIFDNIMQLKELVLIMNPEAIIKKGAKISDIIDFLRGKVSYFPGTSINAYPSVEYNIHDIIISKTQDVVTRKIIDDDADEEKNDDKEAFMAKQRQASISCLPGNKNIKGNIDQVLSNIHEYSPKIEAVIKVINSSPGKHIIYTNFVQTGVDVVEQLLLKEGWINIKNVVKNDELYDQYKGKIFAIWSGDTKDADKQLIKNIANNKNNMFGDKIRIIIGSPSVKEGVSFKHIQHMHLLDPVWNQSAKTQVEGRAIRFCSHVDIDENINKPLKRKVIVNIYKLIPRPKGLVIETCDQIIYDKIIPRKQKLIKMGEIALKKVAIDHYLFRNLYVDNDKLLPIPENTGSAKSNIGLLERENVLLKQKKIINKIKSTCPKKRRPDVLGNCIEEYYMKKNLHGDDCCYKEKNKKEKEKEKTCPENKMPQPNGECKEGFKLNKNKNCCIKIYKKKN
jgi:hypothetical protein